ncbi:hypothetical protein [Yoonia sp. 208BN28-4]|uniref:hypothetical protein n=1 Tax=Yoonia sp. 208BN28-4 TaxID=3126505 RepID=UPI0030AAD6F4
MTAENLETQLNDLQALMAEKLRVRGPTFGAQLRKAGRALPRGVRRDGAYLAQAETLMQNPKLVRMIDQRQADKAHANIVAHLQTVDPADRIKGRVLGILGSISAVLIFTFIVVVYVLVQRGIV